MSKTRAEEAEPRPYALLAERLERECRLSPEDLVVCVSEDGEADWSFGRGVAPFLTGDL